MYSYMSASVGDIFAHLITSKGAAIRVQFISESDTNLSKGDMSTHTHREGNKGKPK